MLLAAGELVGHAFFEMVEADDFEDAHDLASEDIAGGLSQLERVGHVVKYVHMGPDGVGLEYHADAPLFRRRRSHVVFHVRQELAV